ncbi:NADH-quinone oxidoreductase subunit M [Methyloglobulus sp.]|uniref:complex I subunit 4 family protein n=1 Tax=Methyloglobulus sp. TaxID=2518622 RepID=UPI0032B785E4
MPLMPMSEASFPLLSCIILLPLLGAIVVGVIRDVNLAKKTGLIIASIELVLTLLLLPQFNADDGNIQWVERHAWIPSLNVEYLIGIDGISVLFLPMTALLTLMSVLASWNTIQHLSRFHLALLLVLEGVTLGVFCALDLVLFFLFWELTLPLIFFLIGLWGIGAERRLAAIKYTLFMLFGGISLLLAIIILALNHSAQLPEGGIAQELIFNLPALLKTPLPEHLQTIVFVLLLLGFAVKAPLPPFHTWLPTVAMEGSPHTTALLVGLKLGVYGIIRFTLPLAPSAAVEYSWVLGVLGAITLIYGALIALYQTNLRRLLAYASISHVGLVIIGIASLNMQGIQGALFQLFNFTIIASSLMLIAGFIQHRLGSTEVVHLGGLAKVMPKLTCFYFIFTLASIGIPGTSGFPAELLLIISALVAHPSLGIAALAAAVLGAAYMLDFTRKAFFGSIIHQTVRQCQDLRRRELLLLCALALLVLVFGLFPNLILHTHEKAADMWLSQILEQPIKSDEVADMDLSE